jgi:threonine aldolase
MNTTSGRRQRMAIDLRSDTVTQPTEEMLEAMCRAQVGDERYFEDPTTSKLEAMTAERLGKEGAILMPSGAMANCVAILCHTNRGEAVIIPNDAHAYLWETGQISAISGSLAKTIPSHKGVVRPEDVESVIVSEDMLAGARTSLVWVENTHNTAGGTCTNPQQMSALREVADRHGMAIHVDGERLFNAAVHLGVEARELVEDADSVQIGLSKGLACPFGSVLVGDAEFIRQARRHKLMMGGGMRQSGFMAAAGIVALENMVSRLQEDHENARVLAEGLVELGLDIDLETVQTNIVYLRVPPAVMDVDCFVAEIRSRGVLVNPRKRGTDRVRMVTHYGLDRGDIDLVLGIAADTLAEAGNGLAS